MKKSIFATILVICLAGLASCSNCKKCSVNVLGTEVGSDKELCGEELKQAEAAGLNCK